MDFVLVPRDSLGHGDLATGFVVDLRRKARQTVSSILRMTRGPKPTPAGSGEMQHRLPQTTEGSEDRINARKPQAGGERIGAPRPSCAGS